jgi:hypothetical protein
MVAALGQHGDVLHEGIDALRRVGWDVRDDELVVVEPALREMFFLKETPPRLAPDAVQSAAEYLVGFASDRVRPQ